MSKAKAKNSTALVRRAEARLVQLERPAAKAGKSVIEQLIQLARDPRVDVTKIDRLLDANERVMRMQAKAAFDQAFAAMQVKIPIIAEDGQITIRDKQDPGRVKRTMPYARQVDIVRAVRPVLSEFGFAIRFRHRMDNGLMTVTGILSHAGGHAEEDEFQTTRDDSGEKNLIQSWASARSYGERYVTRALLNIVSESEDDDGQAAGMGEPRTPPQARAAASTRPANPQSGEKVTGAQLKRLFVIVQNSGRDVDDVKEWIYRKCRIESTKDMLRRDYDAVCSAVEAPGSLPA